MHSEGALVGTSEPAQSGALPGAKRVIVVLLVCILPRLILFGLVRPWSPRVEAQAILQGDAAEYHQLAITMLERHRFLDGATGRPEAIRTPIYPLLVASTYFLFGYRPWVVLLVQIIIDTFSCFLLLLTLSRNLDRRSAIAGSLFYALDPFLIMYCSRLLSDVLNVCFLVAALYLFGAAMTARSRRTSLSYYAACGLFTGLAALVRPISQYLPLILVAVIFVSSRRQPEKALKYSAAYLLAAVLALSPWIARNCATFGSCSLSTSGSYNLLVLNIAPMEMVRHHRDAETVRKMLLSEAGEMMAADGLRQDEVSPFQEAKYLNRLAARYIKSDPLLFGKIYLLGVFHTLFSVDSAGYARLLGLPQASFDIKAYASIIALFKAFVSKKGATGLLIAGLIAPYLLVSYFCAIVGLVVSWRRYDRCLLWLSLVVAVYFVLVTGAAGTARFKLPSIPFYLVFAGSGANWLFERIRSKPVRRDLA